jgi:hypothetical protein
MTFSRIPKIWASRRDQGVWFTPGPSNFSTELVFFGSQLHHVHPATNPC